MLMEWVLCLENGIYCFTFCKMGLQVYIAFLLSRTEFVVIFIEAF